MIVCDKRDCGKPADGAVGIRFFPPMALQTHYNNYRSMGKALTSLRLCNECFKLFKPLDAFDAPFLQNMGIALGASAGIRADISLCVGYKIAFDDPEYVALTATPPTHTQALK